MEKIKKDNRCLHMQYPAPYSHSWAGMGQPSRSFILDKASSKTSSGFKPAACPHCSIFNHQPRYTGFEPTTHHLKYGLFPKKMYISRGQSRILTVKPSVRAMVQTDDRVERDRLGSPRKRCITEERRLRIERPTIAKTSTLQKFLTPSRAQSTGTVEFSDGPVFVFRPLVHRELRSLSVSASTHLDIKPRPARGLTLSPQLYARYI